MGESVRVVDLNNSGDVNILVVCRNPGTFVIYSRGNSPKSWILQDECNGNMSLGDINDQSLFVPDYRKMFKGQECKNIEPIHLRKICKRWRKGVKPKTITSGVTLADINNDGFIDALVSHTFGDLRFFHNVPSEIYKSNKFITFRLVGDGVNNNSYGIGATLILSSRKKNGKFRRQLREVSYFQHTSDNNGYEDERIHFGLGADEKLDRLLIKWPNGRNQVIYLKKWSFSSSTNPIDIADPSCK